MRNENTPCFRMLSGGKGPTVGKHLEQATKIMPNMPEIVSEIPDTQEGERLDEEKATQSSCSVCQRRVGEESPQFAESQKAQVPQVSSKG